MKRAIVLSFLLAGSGVLLGDSRDTRGPSLQPPPLLQDLVRLTNGGLAEETVLAYAKAHRAELPPRVSTDNLLWLRKHGVAESVIRYMTAIDVRPSEDAEEVLADDPERETRYFTRADAYGDESDGDDGSYPESSYSSYGDRDYANSPDSYDYGAGYWNDFSPVYGAGGYYYPYSVYFFPGNGGYIRRFHRRGHGFAGRHGRSDRHRDFGRPRHSRHDFDRSRGGGRRSFVAGHRGPGRSMHPRGGYGPRFAAPRGDVMRGGGGGRPSFPRPSFGRGAPAPRGGVVHNGGFRSPSFSGGFRSPGGVARAPVARSGGRPGGGQPMARGRR